MQCYKKYNTTLIQNGCFMVTGTKALAEALKSNSVLAYMDLGYNKLEDEGGSAVIDSLVVNTSLQVFLSFLKHGINLLMMPNSST
jgi:hypothetical protein